MKLHKIAKRGMVALMLAAVAPLVFAHGVSAMPPGGTTYVGVSKCPAYLTHGQTAANTAYAILLLLDVPSNPYCSPLTGVEVRGSQGTAKHKRGCLLWQNPQPSGCIMTPLGGGKWSLEARLASHQLTGSTSIVCDLNICRQCVVPAT
jgi:hypothetical protein